MSYNVSTFGNVVDEAFNELGVDSDSGAPGLSQTEMEAWGNRFSKVFIEKVKMKAREDTTSFRTIADKNVATAPSSGAVSLVLDSVTGMSNSGVIVIDGVPSTYSNISTLTLTVPALPRAFNAGDAVQVGYSLPTNFGKPISLHVDGVRYELAKWGRNELVPERHYAVYADYLFLPQGVSGSQDVTLHFYEKATNTLSDVDSMEVYQMWDSFVIYKLTARGFRLLYDSQRANEYEALAMDVLRSAKQMMAEEDMSPNRAFVPDW